jgi:hypothetical protein
MGEAKNIIDGKAAAYTTVVAPGMVKWQIAIVREDEDGYRPVADYGERPLAEAERIARQLNERLGVSEEEALRILTSSLCAANTSRRRTARTKKRGGRA